MKTERGQRLIEAMLQSLERWTEEAAQLQVTAGSEAAKYHFLASLRQSRLSLEQLLDRADETG